MASPLARESEFLNALFTLSIVPQKSQQAVALVASLSDSDRDDFLKLADSHHVVVRSFRAICEQARVNGDQKLFEWAQQTIRAEEERIATALTYLDEVCKELEAAQCPTTVMKTLDHLPDMGNDLDLYSTANEQRIVKVFTEKFHAHVEPRSWGDRLANKWNFAIPGLKEAVEVHVQRLGQTGEHTALARRFVTRRQEKSVLGRTYFVPAPEERIIVATLQRMYRHFYLRVCDILNSAAIVESGEMDFNELKRASESAGIWPGVATYLMIVSDHMKRYRGTGLELPQSVVDAARFGGDLIKPRARFLRVPIMPHGAALYTHQVTTTAMRGDVPGTFRLSLLPYLASAAAVAYKITGSDKGVW